MQTLNDLFTQTLGWTNAPEFFGLFIIAAAALLVILLITIIVAAVMGSKKKKRIKTLERENANNREYTEAVRAGNEDAYSTENVDVEAIKAQAKAEARNELEAELRSQIAAEYAANAPAEGGNVDVAAVKAELEPQLRTQIEAELRDGIEAQVRAEYAETFANAGDSSAQSAELSELQIKCDEQQQQIEQLHATIDEKNNRIDELGELLMQAGSDHKSDNGELYVQINALNKDNAELSKQVNALQAENAKLKSAAQKPTGSATKTAAKSPAKSTTTKATPDVKIVRSGKTAKTAEPIITEDEEVYNDFGDADSKVKVTLKFDAAKANWAIYRSDTARVYRRIVTKQEALVVAKDLAKRLHAQLLVYTKDGKTQKL